MKIQIKLLKGDLFSIEADGTDNIASLKEKIQVVRSDLAADRQKLIHSGKVLKDTQTMSEIGISETDFLVCMVTKEVAKPKQAAPAPTPAPAATGTPAAAPAPVAGIASTPSVTTPLASTGGVGTPLAPPVSQPNYVQPDALAALTGMGFPEAECRAALQAAMGNPDMAYEFLLVGIPETVPRITAPAPIAAPAASAAGSSASGGEGIAQLRNHPQFAMLQQLIQSNPAALPQVLGLIGQQSPELLQAIHANEEEFIAMMNEPIAPTLPAAVAAAPAAAPLAGNPFAPAPGSGAGYPPNSGTGAGPNPAQLVQMLAAMPPEQRAHFAQTMGLSPEQLASFMQMVASMPPEQLNQMLAAGPGGGFGGATPPAGAITLTHAEMDSVNRLMQLGFSQAAAAQAFIACDRNETLAANFLFENGWGDDGDEGDFGPHDDDHDDNMYS